MNGPLVRILINDRPHFLTIYVLINSKLQHPPPGATPRWFKLLKISLFKFRPPGAKIGFKCPSQMLNLMVIFFVKGKTKSATVTFHILTLQTFSSEPFAGESGLITFKHLYI